MINGDFYGLVFLTLLVDKTVVRPYWVEPVLKSSLRNQEASSATDCQKHGLKPTTQRLSVSWWRSESAPWRAQAWHYAKVGSQNIPQMFFNILDSMQRPAVFSLKLKQEVDSSGLFLHKSAHIKNNPWLLEWMGEDIIFAHHPLNALHQFNFIINVWFQRLKSWDVLLTLDPANIDVSAFAFVLLKRVKWCKIFFYDRLT